MRAFVKQEPICKGWSCESKYCVTDQHGTKYLLRITPPEKSASREDMFRLQQTVAALDVPMCRPVEMEVCDDGVYILQTWIDGQDAEDVIPGLPEAEQYALGLDAGRILKRIHTIPAPADQPAWGARFNAKMDRKIRAYEEAAFPFDGAERMIAYLNANRHLLAERPQCFQHGDYHIGNMMLQQGKLVIIDFDRYDFGDPWEEFNRITWSAQAAPVFACGMVDGYFDGPVPMEFWKLMALYICSDTLGAFAWAVSFGARELETMQKRAADVLRWYDHMQNPIPTWYRYKE